MLAVLAADFLHPDIRPFSRGRVALGFLAVYLLTFLSLAGQDALGLRNQAAPSWRYWPKWSLIAGTLVLAGSAALIGLLMLFGKYKAAPQLFQHPSQFADWLRAACLWAPVEEELLYRAVLCAPLAAFFPMRVVVILGGVVFSALHYHYGVWGPNHLFAGFVLTWAYLRSGTLLVPILLHALGNLAVFVVEVVRVTAA